MFNQEQKQEYINQQEEYNAIALTNYFKRLKKAEIQLNKDLADMDYEEIKGALISLNIHRVESRGHLLTLIKNILSGQLQTAKHKTQSIISMT